MWCEEATCLLKIKKKQKKNHVFAQNTNFVQKLLYHTKIKIW